MTFRLCSMCRLDGGWRYYEDGSFDRCDHGELERAVEAAEEADRAAAAETETDQPWWAT